MNRIPNNLEILSNEFVGELVNSSKDTSFDYTELALESIFDSEIIKQIPVIKTIATICNTGLAIRDRYFANKLLTFLDAYKNGTVNEEDKNKFISEMQNDNYKTRVVDTLMVYIDGFTELTKSTILAKLLLGYINGNYGWSKFIYFSDCLNLLFINDIEVIQIFYQNKDANLPKKSDTLLEHQSSLNRLEHLGFILSESYQSLTFGKTLVEIEYRISNDGKQFYENI